MNVSTSLHQCVAISVTSHAREIANAVTLEITTADGSAFALTMFDLPVEVSDHLLFAYPVPLRPKVEA